MQLVKESDQKRAKLRGLTPNISQFAGLCNNKSALATVMMLYY